MKDADRERRTAHAWTVFVEHPTDPMLRLLARHAVAHPVLKSLFPFGSHSHLRLSRSTQHPFDSLPFIGCPDGDVYVVFNGRHDELARGSLEEMMPRLAQEMERALRERS
jgi:hypothetical protein